MNPIESILDHYPVLVIDGALATELERRGCNLKDDLWSAKILLEQPEKIKQVHYDYFKAGADCAITASYQATMEGFSKRGLSEPEALALIQKSVRLAIEARDEFWGRSRQTASEGPGHLLPLPWDPTGLSLQMDRSTVEIMVSPKAS